MKHNTLARVLSLLLAVTFLLGGGTAAASAEEKIGAGTVASDTDTTIEDITELMNASTYSKYKASAAFHSALQPTESIVIDATKFNAEKTSADVKVVKVDEKTGVATIVPDDYVPAEGEQLGLYTPNVGETAFDVTMDVNTRYCIAIDYFPLTSLVDENGETVMTDKSGSIERILKIDGSIPFSEARYVVMSKIWKNVYTIKMSTTDSKTDADGNIVKTYSDVTPYVERAKKCGIEYKVADDKSTITLYLPEGGWTGEIASKVSEEDLRFFTTDIDGNEIRCTMERIPEWRRYECKDVDGFFAESFQFLFYAGQRTISLEAKSQAMVIRSVTLFPSETFDTYDEFNEKNTGKADGSDSIKIEAEFPYASSSQTIYSIEDTSSAATSPSDTNRTILNTLGGEKWQTSGQWIRYSFKVANDGMYSIVTRFRQNVYDGIFSSRILKIYSDGLNKGDDGYYNGVPFEEATQLRFGYSTDWQVSPLRYYKEEKVEGKTSKWNPVDLEFYFKAGVTYTVELEVALGDMGEIVSNVSTALSDINGYYLNILKLTGADPDQYNDYGFNRIMPDTMQGLIRSSDRLYDIADELKNIAGAKSSNVATLEKIAWLLREMGTDEDNVAKYMEQLKTYIGTLGTWINDNKTQPLELDYIMIQSPEAELPRAKANFFQAIWHEILKFIQSFFRNYNRMGATTSDSVEEATVEVWLAKGRDQSQVIRNLINNEFTPQYGYLVNLKLVAGATLLPSILAGSGPDVYIGVSEDNIINYAIRGALNNIENYEGFYDMTNKYVMEHKTVDDIIAEFKAENYIVKEENGKVYAMSADGVAMHTVNYNADGSGEVIGRDGSREYGFNKDGWLFETGSTFSGVTYSFKQKLDENGNAQLNPSVQFNEAAMYTLGLPDADNIMHYYGLPEEQNFSMMFVRNDILANLGIEVPKTWADVQAAIPTLQANNMMIGMSNDYKIFLYQEGSKLFADDGMRINLDSNVALESFDYMCNLFTMYSFPYKYDFSNRFRTGEMPIGIASYNGTYNQLIVFATEIRGLWSFYPIPGIETTTVDEEGNKVTSVNNVAVASVSAISMISGCDCEDAAWAFMKWHVSEDCQVNYSNEMVAILGDSAKYATANMTALESMPWTTAEYKQLKAQFDSLASIPNYPGSYIIGRYTKFAFLAAFDKKANPADSLMGYIDEINKEVKRKRAEFKLETLEVSETLASKRIDEALAMLEKMSDSAKKQYATQITALLNAINNLESRKAYVSDEHILALKVAVDNIRATQYSDCYQIADKLDTAVTALIEYQKSY